MTEYYVKTDGNNGDTGVDWDHAWQTIEKAQNTVGAGDAIWIGEGEYPEQYGLTFSPPADTEWRADPGAVSRPHLFTTNYATGTLGSTANSNIAFYGLKFGGYGGGGYPSYAFNGDSIDFHDCCFDWVVTMNGAGFKFYDSFCEANAYLTLNGTGIDIGNGGANPCGYICLTIGSSGSGSIVGCTSLSMDSASSSVLSLRDNTFPAGASVQFDGWNSGSEFVNNILGDDTTVLNFGSAILNMLNCVFGNNIGLYTSTGINITSDTREFFWIAEAPRGWIVDCATTHTTLVYNDFDGHVIVRPVVVTPEVGKTVSVKLVSWDLAGDQNKGWTVDATGDHTITFALGDMLPDTKYDLLVGGAKVSDATSDASGVITFPAYSGSFSEKEFETEKGRDGKAPVVMIF